ncbi:MAG: hypothetical protein ACMUIU_13810 [bacterium]
MCIKNFKDTEYTFIRSQIGEQDRACLSMVGILLTSSTAIYGLAIEKQIYSLLPILSIIWVVGFLYICEKRFWIRRSALYAREMIESKESGLYWQTWLKENENDKRFLRFSPLKLEYLLLLIVNIMNVILTSLNLKKNIHQYDSIVYFLISAFTLFISLVLFFLVVRVYYHKAKAA